MKNGHLDYDSMDVDERLLVHQSSFKKLLVAQFPQVTDMDEKRAKRALLRTHELFGFARRVTGPDGRVRLEPTPKNLKAHGLT
jgi:hypothetical protein